MLYAVAALLTFCPLLVVHGKCYEPSPAFPVPTWNAQSKRALQPVFENIGLKLEQIAQKKKYDSSSFSVALTSGSETLFEHHHTAKTLNETRPGAASIDGSSVYRIASITKVFTTLALLQQYDRGKLDLNHPISEYVAEFADSDALPWKDITLRILASQLSGIPREFAQSDLITSGQSPSTIGLPKNVSTHGLPHCGPYNHYVPCNRTELIDAVKKYQPVFAPNQRSTYSNVAFILLGLAISNVTNMTYENYIKQAILEPVTMTSTAFEPGSDDHAVLPVGDNFWDIDLGISNPTGGLRSSTTDMTAFLRYILAHYNTLATGINWLLPSSWSTSMHSFYGMPFEIFRTDRVLDSSQRAVTFVTKGGSLPGYYSRIYLLEEYGLGMVILVGGDRSQLLAELQEVLTVDVVRAAEELVWENMRRTYTGHYVALDAGLNSSLEITASPSHGLVLESFVSNHTDVLKSLNPTLGGLPEENQEWRMQLSPTLLYKNESKQDGEIFRALFVPARPTGEVPRQIWDDDCLTDIEALGSYAGVPLNEVVFWHEEGLVEVPAWRVKMKPVSTVQNHDRTRLIIQGP